ncbi:MAG: peptidoglycan-binding protein [Chthoniobacterales bacterium]
MQRGNCQCLGSVAATGILFLAVDGVLGPATEAAIANYQRDYALPVTGAIDPALQALNSRWLWYIATSRVLQPIGEHLTKP